MKCKLSVCMATCNGSLYIREQLESILPQLKDNDELIISDDGSTDNTLDILNGYQDARIQILSGNRFRSPIRNFENALKKSCGQIIVLSDQDDVWLPGRIALIHERLDEKIGTISLLMMDGEIVDASGNRLKESIFDNNRAGVGIIKNVYDNTYTGCCIAFTRPLLEISLPFPNRIPMHDMWLGILAEIFGQVEFTAVKTIKYRRHGANTSFARPSIYEQIARRIFLVLNLIKRYFQVISHNR